MMTRKNKDKIINGLNIYSIRCTNCSSEYQGRFFHVGWSSSIHYCTKCANILIDNTTHESDLICKCGGSFISDDLICPQCQVIISDREKQLAAQHYDIKHYFRTHRGIKLKKISEKDIDCFYRKMREAGYFTGRTLFIQIQEALNFDEKIKKWRYFKPFEI